MSNTVIALSGGMDSATLLGELLSNGHSVFCCLFDYGSKHNKWERSAAKNIIDYYKSSGFDFKYKYLNIESAFDSIQSSLMESSGKDIPEGHYEAESMKQTVVPGRNLIFASIMSGIAESIYYNTITLGVHSGDHHIYPDCRPEFISNLNETVKHSSDMQVHVYTPFIKMNKKSIIELGMSLNPQVPYHLTRTCYKDQILSCGKCGSCRERLEAFELVGISDPIDYEE